MNNSFSIEKIKNTIQDKNIQTICIDYFDTVVYRDTHEANMRRFWARHLSDTLMKRALYISAETLYTYRLQAESKAKKIFGYGHEATYKSVIKLLYLFLDSPERVQLDDLYSESLRCEVEIELEHQIVDAEMVKFLKEEKEKGKHLLLVSDFYLPQSAFEDFLRAHSLEDIFEQIFVSSDLDKRKSDGSLYDLVLKAIGTGQGVLMIGDSQNSDYQEPIRKGMMAIHRPATSNNEKYTKESVLIKIKGIIEKNTHPFSNYSLVLYLFLEKLYYEITLHTETDVYFLSREGQYLKELFDWYLDKKKDDSVKTHYFCVSRYALSSVINDSDERDGFWKYLNSIGITSRTGKVVIVDVGWKGTMQDMLHTILPNTLFLGYYIGTTEFALVENNSIKKGLVFSYYPHKSYAYDCMNYNSFLQEQLLSANHGSVVGYSDKGIPRFEINESIKDVYEALQPFRNEVAINLEKYFEIFRQSGFCMSEYMKLCASEYVKMMLNRNTRFTEERKKYISKDVCTFEDNKGNDKSKIKRLLKSISWLKSEQSDLISYYRIFEMYSEKLGLQWTLPFLSRIIAVCQVRNLENEDRKGE